jgi:hypothetical protein
VNGGNFAFYFASGRKSVEVDLGVGTDALILWGLNAADVTASLGSGNDWAAIVFSRIARLDIDGGAGTDRVFNLFSRIDANSSTAFEQ